MVNCRLASLLAVAVSYRVVHSWEISAYRNVRDCTAESDTEYRLFYGSGEVSCQSISDPPGAGVDECAKYLDGGATGPLDCDHEDLCQGISCDPPYQYISAYVNGTTEVSGASIDFTCLMYDNINCASSQNSYMEFDHTCGSIQNAISGSYVAFSCSSGGV